MAADSFFFNGQQYFTPSTVSMVNDSGFTSGVVGEGNTLAIVGASLGGQPNVAQNFSSPNQAAPVLISGDVMTAVNKAFDPSDDPNVGIPGTIIAMVVGEATPATLTIQNSGGSNIGTLQTQQYGLPANQVTVKLQNGSNSFSTAPTYALTVQVGTNPPIFMDNIYRDAFTVSYSGIASTSSILVTDTSCELLAPQGATVATFLFTQFTTVDQLVAAINAVPGFSATVGPNATGTPTAAALDWPSTAIPLTGGVVKTITANTQAIFDYINNSNAVPLTATRTAGLGMQPALFGSTLMAGAASPAPVVGDWANAFSALQSVDCQHIAVLSANPAVWALAQAHVAYMSTIGKKERRAYFGPALGTTVAAAEAMPFTINSDRCALCFPGYQDFNSSGQLIVLPSYQTAALVAAMFAGSSPGTPMTNKTINVQGVELVLRDPTDTDPLIESGVLCVMPTSEGYKVVRSISTWLQSSAYDKVEISTGCAVDYIMRTIRDTIDALRGGRQGPALLGQAISIAESVLTDMAKPLPQGPGVLVGDANSPPFKNVTASIQGDALLVSWQMSPVIPNNFIGCTATLSAYSGTASA